MDELLTVAEVAAILKLNPQTVRNWIDQGSLAAVRVGRRVRIRREDFQALIDQGYSGGQPQTRGFDAQAVLGRLARSQSQSTPVGPGPIADALRPSARRVRVR